MQHVITEKVLATKGEWIVVGRLSAYTTKEGKVRRCEMVFLIDQNLRQPNDLRTGWTAPELANLHNLLVQWQDSLGPLHV